MSGHERKVTTVSGYEYEPGDDHNAATNHYAGLLCCCGDYSCPAMSDATETCAEQDYEVGDWLPLILRVEDFVCPNGCAPGPELCACWSPPVTPNN